jgi:hypothetical protein
MKNVEINDNSVAKIFVDGVNVIMMVVHHQVSMILYAVFRIVVIVIIDRVIVVPHFGIIKVDGIVHLDGVVDVAPLPPLLHVLIVVKMYWKLKANGWLVCSFPLVPYVLFIV